MSPLLVVLGVVTLLVIVGAIIALISTSGQSTVDERLEEFVGTGGFDQYAQEEEDEDSNRRQSKDFADQLDSVLSGRSFFGPIRESIARADVKLRVSEYLLLLVISTAGVAALGYFILFDQNIVLTGVAAFIGFRLPRTVIGRMASNRVNAFNSQLADTLSLWVNSLRAGSSVLQGMETIATESPPPVSVEFERVIQEVRLGLTVSTALANMYRRVPSEDLDLVITAVNIQREVGGNLADVLDSISFTIRERIRIKGEIRVLTSQGRASGAIISLLPIILGLVLFLINPGYVSELWVREPPMVLNVPCGWFVLATGGFMIFFGWLAIQKIVDIEV